MTVIAFRQELPISTDFLAFNNDIILLHEAVPSTCVKRKDITIEGGYPCTIIMPKRLAGCVQIPTLRSSSNLVLAWRSFKSLNRFILWRPHYLTIDKFHLQSKLNSRCCRFSRSWFHYNLTADSIPNTVSSTCSLPCSVLIIQQIW